MCTRHQREGGKKGRKPFNAKKRENVSFGTNSEGLGKGGWSGGREFGQKRGNGTAALLVWH